VLNGGVGARGSTRQLGNTRSIGHSPGDRIHHARVREACDLCEAGIYDEAGPHDEVCAGHEIIDDKIIDYQAVNHETINYVASCNDVSRIVDEENDDGAGSRSK